MKRIIAGCIVCWIMGSNVPLEAVLPIAYCIMAVAVAMVAVAIALAEPKQQKQMQQSETRAWGGSGQGAVLQEVTG